MSLSLGVGLTLGGRNLGASSPPNIAAIVTPAAEDLLEGDTVGDITNIATYRSTSNYTALEGTIASVEVLVDGTARPDTFALTAGESIVVRVTDSLSGGRNYTIDAAVASLTPEGLTLRDNGDGTASILSLPTDNITLTDNGDGTATIGGLAMPTDISFVPASQVDPANLSDTDFADAVDVDEAETGDTVTLTPGVTYTALVRSDLLYTQPEVAQVPAPTAAGGLADQSFIVGEAIAPIDVATDFTGDNITYSLSPTSPAGLTMTTAGIISGTPDAEVSSLTVVVTGTNSGGSADSAFSLTVEAAVPPISITNNPEGTITINGDGAAQITLTEPPEYAGTYNLSATQVANLATTPVNLVAPTLTGANPGEVGDTYALEHPGLWAFDGTEPTATYQWQRNGVNTGQTDQTGYLTTAPGAVRLVETFGGQSQATAAATVGAASGFTVTGVDNWSVDVNTQNYTRAIADLSAGEDFILTFSSISSGDYFTDATLAGMPGVLIAEASQNNSEYSQSWLFTGVTGASGDLVMTGASNTFRRMSLELVAVADYQVANVAALESGSDATATITADVLVGDVVLATFGKGRNGNDAVFDPVVGFTATQNVNQANRPTCTGGHDVAADETARVFSVTGDAGQRNVGLVIILRTI